MLFSLLLLLFQAPQVEWDYNQMDISLITCDPGAELYSVFGHSALRVKSDEMGIDHVYNWGTFDFNTDNFYIKFMRGKLPYKLTVAPYSNFLYEYHYTRRGVYEQVLNLSAEEKKSIWEALSENLKPENIEYPYDFFFDNCSTRIRDIILSHVSGLPHQDNPPPVDKKTYRNLIHEYLGSMPWTRLGIDLLIGRKADREADFKNQMFLPDYMHDNLAMLEKSTGAMLMQDSYVVLPFEEEREYNLSKRFPWPIPVFLLLSSGIFILAQKMKLEKFQLLMNILWGIMGAMGLFLLFMVLGTDHIATKLNYNLMYLHPGYFLFFLIKSVEQRKKLYYLFIGLAVLYLILAMVGVANSAINLWPLVIFTISVLSAGLKAKLQKDEK
jgi:hypothetical protein